MSIRRRTNQPGSEKIIEGSEKTNVIYIQEKKLFKCAQEFKGKHETDKRGKNRRK